jgi:hypothetical protein
VVGEVRIAASAPGPVADSLEFLDRPSVAFDRLLERLAPLLDDADVDQAASDLLDAADALSQLEPAS